jgi:3-phenylpropionate/trans-cinnamate dioxygenase ferredoxin reductase subunit
MPDYKYLIIGGGMTADSAVKGIQGVDGTGSIGIITSEPHPPYNRPPLSKALWKGKPLESVWRKTSMDGVTIRLSRTAKSLDVKRKIVLDDKGEQYSYNKLLLATGGVVRRGPW